jgi:hypothetical protein
MFISCGITYYILGGVNLALDSELNTSFGVLELRDHVERRDDTAVSFLFSLRLCGGFPSIRMINNAFL